MAQERTADGLFFAVDYGQSAVLCKQAKLKAVPAGQIYCDGELKAALSLGGKDIQSSWSLFRDTIDTLRGAPLS